tara:strand:+ start:148 stop:261 length:114 start_codon:yes stop_codon:yes gene_type:complete
VGWKGRGVEGGKGMDRAIRDGLEEGKGIGEGMDEGAP